MPLWPSRLVLAEGLQRAGVPGVLGLALSAFAAVVSLTALLPAKRELAEVRQAIERASRSARNSANPERPASTEEQLASFYGFFPPREQAPDLLDRIYVAAEQNQMATPKADYTVTDDRKSGLVSYQVLIPLTGEYAQIRSFVDAALEAVPTLAIDELDFAREGIADTQLNARVRFNLYLSRP